MIPSCDILHSTFAIHYYPGLSKEGFEAQISKEAAILVSALLPAMFSHEFDESASTKVGLLNITFFPIDLDKLLGMLVADGYHQSASFDQLMDQHFGNVRGAGGYHNRIEGTFLLPPFGAIAISGYNIMIIQFVEKTAGLHIK